MTTLCSLRTFRKDLSRLTKWTILAGLLAASPSLLQADEYLNGDVEELMSDGDSTYRFTGPYSRAYGNSPIEIGSYNSNNAFIIENGATGSNHNSDVSIGVGEFGSNSMQVTGADSKWETTWTGFNAPFLYLGRGSGSNSLIIDEGGTFKGRYATMGVGEDDDHRSDNNTVLVDGTGSSLEFAGSFNIGELLASGNTVTVSNGASLKSQNLFVGFGGDNNSVTVTGTNSTWINQTDFSIGGYETHDNKLTISDGAKATSGTVGASSFRIGGTFGSGSEVLVTGEGSSFTIGGDMQIGSVDASGSFLTAADEGIFVLGSDSFSTTLSFDGDGSFRLNNGYVAWHGNHVDDFTNFIVDGRFQFWDNETSQWITGAEGDFVIEFLSGLDGSAFTGGLYNGLEGYTIITSIPEPSTWALLGLALGGVTLHRFRSNRAKNRAA